MFRNTDLSILEPFLSLEQAEWADLVHLGDDILAMAEAPNALDSFRYLLEDLQHSPGKPLALCGTSRCFSPERCNALLKGLAGPDTLRAGRNAAPGPLSGFTMTREENLFGGLIRWLRSAKRPVTMVFQGDVSLSFLGIGLACDCRIAASDTTFYNQGRDHDMPPGAGLLYLLPAYVGLGRAHALVTRTTELSAYSALKWGLLDEVVMPSELVQTIRTMAREVSCFSSETLGTIRQLLNQRLPDFETYFAMETQGLGRALREEPREKLPDQKTRDASL
ncbi:MAG: enoyl-CoA hydratase/isomerase family protein [Phycisphaerales bacterium]